MTASHLFVTRGNILHIECDAWLLPTDTKPGVRRSWSSVDPSRHHKLVSAKSSAFLEGKVSVAAAEDWPLSDPLPLLTAIPTQGVRSAGELAPSIQAFIDFAAEITISRRRDKAAALSANGQSPELPRPRPLLAMPLLGTGGGGANVFRGDVLEMLFQTSQEAASRASVDIVLVLEDERDFALAQVKRKQSPDNFWPSLDADLRALVTELAGKACTGKLVPFLGAGTSISAGAPTWKTLIKKLASNVGLTRGEIGKLEDLNVLDQAAYLRELYQDEGQDFGSAVKELVDLPRYGLAPSLLSGLPSKEAITLNYDKLFEFASSDAQRPRTVLPGNHDPGTANWLLKLHGSVDDPDGIVLTREDYLGYSASREALSALVKATLITQHLLFVGFGLADDHFHAIVHDVERALSGDNKMKEALGTALTLFDDPLQSRLWAGKLRLVPMSKESTEASEAARSLEIFLDALLAYATDSHTYLLAPEFRSALTTTEQRLADHLKAFIQSVSDEEKQTPAWSYICSAIEKVGWKG